MTINKLSSHLSPCAIVTIFVTDFPVQRGLDPSHQLTESDVHESHLPEQIGLKWKDFARELGFLQSTTDMIENEKLHCNKECCIELLVRWMRQNGTETTVGKLKEALEKIEFKNVGENLISGKHARRRNVSGFLLLKWVCWPTHNTINITRRNWSLGECVRGSTIGLAGCGIWLFFVVILGMRAENRSGMREF